MAREEHTRHQRENQARACMYAGGGCCMTADGACMHAVARGAAGARARGAAGDPERPGCCAAALGSTHAPLHAPAPTRAQSPRHRCVYACMHAGAGCACVLTEDSCVRACMQEFEVLKSQVEDEWARLCDPTQYEGKLFDLCAQFDMQQVRACACACVCVC